MPSKRILGIALVAGAVLVAVAALAAVTTIGAGWHDGMMQRHHGGANTAGDPPVTGGASATVTIRDNRFSPGNLVVPRGATVAWKNEDRAPHDATADGDAWETGRLRKGDSDSLTFDEPGTYDYLCTVHPSMKARLTVQ